ncbi:MAG: hypothetical protein AAB434_12025 [Planctomycetota bacterium]
MLRLSLLPLVMLAPVAGEEFRFDWPDPSRVHVREESKKGAGGSAVTQFDLVVSLPDFRQPGGWTLCRPSR